MLLLPILLLVQSDPAVTAQAEQIRCVAALAIVASEQERGAEGWEDYPGLSSRGAEWAAQIEEASEGSAAEFRDRVTAEIGRLQQAPAESREATLRAVADGCIPLLDAAVPPATLVQCAAMTQISYRDIHEHEGLSSSAKDMATIASVLEHRAREQLRVDGNSDADADRILSLAREEIAGEAAADFDFAPCFELARP